jgi:4-carboxymuconolactone decarboxylase
VSSPPRLPPLSRDQLRPEQDELWRAIIDGPRLKDRTSPPETLGGPFNPWLYSPVAGLLAADLGEHLRFRSSLSPRQREIAILVVGAHWKADYEFWAHAQEAGRAGVPEHIIEAIRQGRAPGLADDGEATVHAIAEELLATGNVSDERYAAGVAHLGEPGLVDLVLLVGYYCTVSMTLNAFRVALPPGVDPVWRGEPS